jgi:hypothetical protein
MKEEGSRGGRKGKKRGGEVEGKGKEEVEK